MFTSRPPHGYSPQQLSELGTAELFVLSSCAFATALELHGLMIPIREHEAVRARAPSIAAPSGSALLH